MLVTAIKTDEVGVGGIQKQGTNGLHSVSESSGEKGRSSGETSSNRGGGMGVYEKNALAPLGEVGKRRIS